MSWNWNNFNQIEKTVIFIFAWLLNFSKHRRRLMILSSCVAFFSSLPMWPSIAASPEVTVDASVVYNHAIPLRDIEPRKGFITPAFINYSLWMPPLVLNGSLHLQGRGEDTARRGFPSRGLCHRGASRPGLSGISALCRCVLKGLQKDNLSNEKKAK